MTSESHAALFEELNLRLQALDCLAIATKDQIRAEAGRMSAGELRNYLDTKLAFVEREIASITHPAFRDECRLIAAITNAPKQRAHCGITDPDSDPYPNYVWLMAAATHLEQEPLCLFCLANSYAMRYSAFPNEDTLALTFLAQALGFVGRVQDSLRLLEAHLGLCPTDYVDRNFASRLVNAFKQRQVDANVAMLVVNALGHALQFVDRVEDEVHLLETLFGLNPGDYAAHDLARWSSSVLRQQQLTAKSMMPKFVCMLASALPSVGRAQDCVRLLEAYLGLKPSDFAARDLSSRLANAFEQRQFKADDEVSIVSNLVKALGWVGREQDGVCLLEAYSCPNFLDCANRELVLWLNSVLLLPEFRTNIAIMKFVRTLADSPLSVGWVKDFVPLLEADLGLSPVDFAARDLPQRLANIFNHRLIEANNASSIVETLAGALFIVDREQDGVCLMEAHLGLRPSDYAASNLGTQLANVFAQRQLTSNNAIGFAYLLAIALRLVGREEDSVQLHEAILDLFDWNEDRKGPSPENVEIVVLNWLTCRGRTDELRAMTLCDQLLPYLRRSLQRPNMSVGDRTRWAEQIQPLRRQMVDVLQHWAGQTQDSERAENLHRQALYTDIELGQRALFERVLMGDREIQAGVDGANLPCPAWPFETSTREDWRPRWRGHLPEGDDGPVDPTCNALALAAFDSLDTPDQTEPLTTARTTTVMAERLDLVDELESFVAQGVDAERLATQLGAGTVFLRAMFMLDGTLRWTALHSDGRQLEALADNLAASASPHDQTRLRWAVALHDLEVSLTYLVDTAPLAIANTTEVESLRQWAARQLAPVVKHARNLQANLEANESNALALRDEWSRLLKQASDAARQTRGDQPPTGEAAIPPLHWLASLLDTGFGPLMTPPSDVDDLVAWKQRTLSGWRAAVELVRSVKQQPAAAEQLPDQLDRATQRLLDRVSEVWNLDPLATALARLTKLPDLVVQVDDVLHGVPVPHLLANGRPLWMQVDSVRVTLSVMLDAFQQQLDERGKADEAENRRMLSVSWFRPHDPAAPGAYRLHHGQQRLAEQYHMEWLAAADDPRAVRRAWLNGLALGGYRAATLLGHGDLHKSAVRLADALWTGGGHDLNRVEFLIVPSCSIGRVQHTGERDVEGFCVALTIHQARGVLACKWKVNAAEAPLFANEVAAQYLKLREQQSPADPGVHLRARAVNLARHTLLNGNARRRPDWPGLNTAAAFELYGRG